MLKLCLDHLLVHLHDQQKSGSALPENFGNLKYMWYQQYILDSYTQAPTEENKQGFYIFTSGYPPWAIAFTSANFCIASIDSFTTGGVRKFVWRTSRLDNERLA